MSHSTDIDKARLLAAASLHSAPPITSAGLRCQMRNSGYQLLTDWVAKRANHKHAAVNKWWTHADSMGWPAGKAPQDSNAIHISTTSFGVQWKGRRFRQLKSKWACFGKTANAPTALQSCRGRGKSRWHGRSQSRTHMPTPTSATQLWKQELQAALPPPTRPTNTANYPQLTSSLQWPLKQPVPGAIRQLSWSRNLEGGRPLSSPETPERPPTCSSSYQWLCKRGTRSRFRTCSQPASLLQRVIYFFLTSIFSAYGFVLAGHK